MHLSVLLVNVCIRKRQARVHRGVSVLLLAREVECDCPKGHMLGLTLPNPLLIHVDKGSSDRTRLHHRTSSEPVFHESSFVLQMLEPSHSPDFLERGAAQVACGSADWVLLNAGSQSRRSAVSLSRGAKGVHKNFYQALQQSRTDTEVTLMFNSSHQLVCEVAFWLPDQLCSQQEVWWSNLSSDEACQLISGFVQPKPSSAFTAPKIMSLILIDHIFKEVTS